ncbi:site-specific integrase [Kordiimonas sp. SCSIO 12610]|uniref:tyrosine-type recombinase/integrase n=1 Tax=Kordiimonas sp. SCSIO 12610 TaxID=2829597 RepID=UPI0021089D81|nr:site-specific integrase [Kordiimonas sp. SCSIO 12610]UTW56586.1 site-specific integrase [Kordiimonas sp. SCSIO 12610]
MAFERKWRHEIHAKEFLGDLDDINLHEAFELFLKTRDSIASHKGLTSIVKGLKVHFDTAMLLHRLTTAEVERWVQMRKDQGRKSQTIQHGIHVMRGTVEHARKLGYRVAEIEWPRMKKDKGRLKYLTVEQEQKLLKELQPNLSIGPKAQHDPLKWSAEKRRARLDSYHLTQMLLDTGARYSEITSLSWRQVDLAERTINLWRSKVSNESVLYMTDRIYTVLKERSENKDHEEWVFANKVRNGPRPHSTAAIRNAMKRAGLDGFRLHDVRHTAASRLVQNGLSLQEVSSILGHSGLQMTARYAHLQPAETSKKSARCVQSCQSGKQTITEDCRGISGMKVQRWLVTVHLPNGTYDQIFVTTNNPANVRQLAEAQSGGKVINWRQLC